MVAPVSVGGLLLIRFWLLFTKSVNYFEVAADQSFWGIETGFWQLINTLLKLIFYFCLKSCRHRSTLCRCQFVRKCKNLVILTLDLYFYFWFTFWGFWVNIWQSHLILMHFSELTIVFSGFRFFDCWKMCKIYRLHPKVFLRFMFLWVFCHF